MNATKKSLCVVVTAVSCIAPTAAFAGKCAGTWKLAGGTGKFAKASGTAQWEFTQLQGKMAAVRWVGNCQ